MAAKTISRDAEYTAIAKQTARITGFDISYVYKVMRLDRHNQKVAECFMDIRQYGYLPDRIPALKRRYGRTAKVQRLQRAA